MSNLLEYRGYHGSIEFSSEDNMMIGTVIGVRDFLGFHGSSIQEVTQSFHDCIDGYLEMCASVGKSPDKEYKGSFNVRISPSLHRDADIAAKKAGMTLNQFVAQAIEEKTNSDNGRSQSYVVVDTARIKAAILSGEDYKNAYKHRQEYSKETESYKWTANTTLKS